MVFMDLCLVLMSQVGDHHPDLNVWTLHNHHEVSLFLFSRLLASTHPAPHPPKTQHVWVCRLLCRFNRSLRSLVETHCLREGRPCFSGLRRTAAVGNAGDCDNDMVPLKPGAGARACTCARVQSKTFKRFPRPLSCVQQTQ